MSKYNHVNMLLVVTLAAYLACGVASAAAAPHYQKVYYDLDDADNLYRKYLEEHNKQYTAEEYGKRLEIFKETLKDINERNTKFPQTVFGPTVFSDMTPEELESHKCFFASNDTKAVSLELKHDMVYGSNLDWRDQGVVSPVKNQGRCGSCYIFSAIGNIEGQYAMKHQQCLSFSEQQALDCVPNNGCDGGYPDGIMNGLAQDRSGVMLESDYPYTAVRGRCVESANKKKATVLSGQKIAANDEETLKQYVAQYGPLSIGLSSADLVKYSRGILHPMACNPVKPDHAVLLVGYGEEAGTPFWIIKNSWGATWGEQGYARMVRGVKACAITSYAATSQVA